MPPVLVMGDEPGMLGRIYWHLSLDPEFMNVRRLGSAALGLGAAAISLILHRLPPAWAIVEGIAVGWMMAVFLKVVVMSMPLDERIAGSRHARERLAGRAGSEGAPGGHRERTPLLRSGVPLSIARLVLLVALLYAFGRTGTLVGESAWIVLLAANGFLFWIAQRRRYSDALRRRQDRDSATG
jgi:hypothetical protein